MFTLKPKQQNILLKGMKKMNKHHNTKNMKNYRPRINTVLIFVLAVIAGLTYTSVTAKSNTDMADIQKSISKKIIRFHVIANSDNANDQELKLKVKDAVVNYTSPLLEHSESIGQTEQILINETENILAICNQVIAENGYNYSVTAEITDTYFPTKSYGSYTFPPGEYRAFQIKIGKAEGQNWWCVLYPPLCFIDISHGVIDDGANKKLQETLTTDEFNAVSGDSEVEFRFKYLTFLNRFL